MKYLLIIIFLFGVAKAQTSFTHTTFNPTGAVVNTGSDTMTVDFPSWNVAVGIQPVITKVSGTVGGSSILYGSIDGVNYVATGDTLVNTNININTKVFKLSTPVYRKYRIITTGTGTMSATAAAVITGLKN